MEDNSADVKLVREALEEHAVSCELAVINNGETAIQFIRGVDAGLHECPGLVIIDLNLPKEPGTEVLKQMLASAKCSRVPVVILTSSDNQKDRDNAAAIGADHYIKKPSRLGEFLALGAMFKQMVTGPD